MPDVKEWMTFCIPLLPRAVAGNWNRVVDLLRGTLRSIDAQSDRRFSVMLAAHERPDFGETFGFEVQFLQADWEPQSDLKERYRDKGKKRLMLYNALRARDGGYAMFLDADDLVSARLVAHVIADRDPNGYLVTRGYAFDRANRRLSPIPGTWKADFDEVCGSCTIINFERDDLPNDDRSNREALSYLLRRHKDFKTVMHAAGRPLTAVPFPAVAYVLNHSQNLHSRMKPGREELIPLKIQRRAIPITPELEAEFSFPAAD